MKTVSIVCAIAATVLLGACDSGDSSGAQDSAAISAAIDELAAAVAEARTKLERLRDFDELENLAGAYGHYVDKSMQDDIADLFAADGIVEILGRGVYYGRDRCGNTCTI